MSMRAGLQLAVGIILGSAAVGAAALELGGFPYQKDLTGPAESRSQIASFALDDEMFAALDAGFANMRLVDPAGAEVPFLVRKKVHTATQAVETVLSSRITGFEELGDNRVRVNVEKDERERGLAAVVQLHTSHRNYQKLVSVAGSKNGKAWDALVQNQPIFDYTRYIDVRNTRIEIPPRPYRFYRIEIANFVERRGAGSTDLTFERRGDVTLSETERKTMWDEAIRIDGVQLLKREVAARPDQPFVTTYRTGPVSDTTDAKRKTSVLTFAAERQPLVSLSFATESGNFSRRVAVEGRDADNRWRLLAGAQLYRVNVGEISREDLTVRLDRPCRCVEYRVTVQNQDNAPIGISGVTATGEVYEVAFLTEKPGTFRIYYGGQGIEAPRYDLPTVLGSLPSSVQAAVWTPGAQQDNPTHKEGMRFNKRQAKLMFTIAVVLMIGLLFWLITKGAARVQAAM